MKWLEITNADELEKTVQESVKLDYVQSLTYEELGHEMALRAASTEHGLMGGFWDRLKTEFHLLVCKKSSKYDDLRKKLDGLSGQSTTILVALISSSLGAAIGATALVITPMVALLMLAAVRLGSEAFCSADDLDKPIKAKAV